MFTPEDIKYDNKHYKYIKFTASEIKAVSIYTQSTKQLIYDVEEFHVLNYIRSSLLTKALDLQPLATSLNDMFL